MEIFNKSSAIETTTYQWNELRTPSIGRTSVNNPFHDTQKLEKPADAILAAKTTLINDAIDEIGWTQFHSKLFCLSGFGFASDSLSAFLQSAAAVQAYKEFGNNGFKTGSTMALYVGFFLGALFWGFMADRIGRRIAFNIALLLASVSTIISGAATGWIFYCTFIGLLGFSSGGNLVLDPTVMLEFTPQSKQWVITALAGWWGVGQSTAGAIAWGSYSHNEWSCDTAEECTWQNNKAWRLMMFTGGVVIFLMSLIRVSVRLPETPKYLLTRNQDEKLVATLQQIAKKHNRYCKLTTEMLIACGEVRQAGTQTTQSRSQSTIGLLVYQVRGLFVSKKRGIVTTMIWISWAGIGLGYPLFFLYLPTLLATRVPNYSPTFTDTWRNYTITNISSIFGPLIAAAMIEVKYIGRKYMMTIGAVITAILFFGYSVIKTPTQNIALSSSISLAINLYYGTLYTYTTEIFPSANRGTGNGIAVAGNRLMGLMSAVISVTADSATATPLYISAGLFLILAFISFLLTFESTVEEREDS